MTLGETLLIFFSGILVGISIITSLTTKLITVSVSTGLLAILIISLITWKKIKTKLNEETQTEEEND